MLRVCGEAQRSRVHAHSYSLHVKTILKMQIINHDHHHPPTRATFVHLWIVEYLSTWRRLDPRSIAAI